LAVHMLNSIASTVHKMISLDWRRSATGRQA
jgi:hypothetical protein